MSLRSFEVCTLVAVVVVSLGASVELVQHANASVTLPDSSAQVVLASSRAIAQAPDYLPSHFELRAKDAEPLPAQF
jgi:hypothetical protein